MAGNNRTTVWKMDTARGFVQWLGGALVIVAIAWSQLAQAQNPARLTAVEVTPMQGNTLQVRLRTDGTAPQPLTFTIDKPARLSVDLPDVGLALENRRIDVGAGGLDTIVAAEATGRTRVVFNLDSLVAYTAVAEGDSVIVTLGAAAAAPAIPLAPLAVAHGHRRSRHHRARFPPLARGRGPRRGPALRPDDAGEPAPGRQPGDRRLHGRRARR